MRDDISSALHNFDKLINLLIGESNEGSRKALKSLRSRARNGPMDILSNGLPATLLYLLSKSSDKGEHLYGILIKSLNEGSIDKRLLKDGFGYAAYTYLILSRCAELGFIDENLINDTKPPIKAISKLIEIESIVLPILLPYLSEIKKLASAVIDDDGNLLIG